MARPATEGMRERLIEAALADMRDCGVIGVRVAEIARRADTSTTMIYRHFDSRDGLLEEALVAWYEERIATGLAAARSILDPPGPITRETVIAGTVPPNYPGSEEAHEFLHRILVVSAEKPNLRARVGEIINDWLDATEEIVTAIVARMDPEEQFDPRIYTIFLVQHGWLANDLRGDRRITNDEFYDFVRHLITNVPPARPVGLDGT